MKRKRGRPKAPPTPREMLLEVLPVKDMFDKDEIKIYNSLIDIYLKDFDDGDLSSSDIDDLTVLATNKIIEIRLLKSSKNAESHLDYSNALAKLREQVAKVKTSLSNRRADRIDTKATGFSIIDIVSNYDNTEKEKLNKRARRMKKEQEALEDSLIKYGNKDDKEVDE
jgi:hypothetical protein